MTIEADIGKLAEMVNGRIDGRPETSEKLTGTCPVDNYAPGKVSFVRSPRYVQYLKDLQGAVIVMPEELSGHCRDYPQNTYIIVRDAADAMITLQEYFYGRRSVKEGFASSAVIDESAVIGEGVSIGEYAVIGRKVTIGSGTVIYPNVIVYENCRIGRDCVIDSGTVIGSAGFRIEQDPAQKTIRRMPHAGAVVIGDRVEIGANTTIDRATFEGSATEIGDDTKIDNLVQVGHNTNIGARNVVAAHSCIGGSVRTGDDVWIGIGVTVSNGVTIGDRTKLLVNAVVAYDVSDEEIVSGFYAMPHEEWKQLWQGWRKA